MPLGLCVGIGAWNYPTQIACWKGAPALACGNAMVFKPSETTPLGALKVAEILHEAGVPAGVYNVIQGRGGVGQALVTDPRVAKVSLTGSVPTGRKVYAMAAEGMKHVTMELGGKSPLIIFADADLDERRLGRDHGELLFLGAGLLERHEGVRRTGFRPQFTDRLIERMARRGDGRSAGRGGELRPDGQRAADGDRLGYIRKGIEEGATLAHGGHRANRPGWFLEPTIFTGVTDEMTIAREEIFGPVLSVLDFDAEDEVIARANATPYGLVGGRLHPRPRPRPPGRGAGRGRHRPGSTPTTCRRSRRRSAAPRCRASAARTRRRRSSTIPNCARSMSPPGRCQAAY